MNAANVEMPQAVLDAWEAFLREIKRAQNGELGDDDKGMRDTSSCDLVTWVDDLEARVGLDTDAARYALHAYLDARQAWNDSRALALLQSALPAGVRFDTSDPRGEHDGGAEASLEKGEEEFHLSLYADSESAGRWYLDGSTYSGYSEDSADFPAWDVAAITEKARELWRAIGAQA